MTASPWIAAWAGLVPAGATVLDVAAGKGRHTRFFAERGHPVTAVDRDVSGLPIADGIEIIAADLEDGSPWPLAGRTFGAVIVTNYLHRPLLPMLLDSVETGGVLLYETFMIGNERFGNASQPIAIGINVSESIDLGSPYNLAVVIDHDFIRWFNSAMQDLRTE